MIKKVIYYGPALALLAAGMVAFPVLTVAQAPSSGAIEQLTATSVNVTGAGGPFRISLMRWSTDAEREQLTSAMAGADGEKGLKTALDKIPTLGYVWTSESAGYFVRYAHRIQTPDGGERIIIVTDQRLGNFDPGVWKPLGAAASVAYPFTVIEVRLNRNGQGEGKASVTTKVTVDSAAKSLALENYASAPVVLKDVKRSS